ncbi:MAG: hypothetical protein QGG05_12005 [Candidatus Latescibacteria bacterium]|nr:hypothetical protein [Candidatus Latescibacterota bacterium]
MDRSPPDVEVDATILRSLAPLDSGVRAFLSQSAQVLSATNLLDRETHLRRLLVTNREEVFTLSHYGRVCFFETPEGPNVGRVLTNSRGQVLIEDGCLVIVGDDRRCAGEPFNKGGLTRIHCAREYDTRVPLIIDVEGVLLARSKSNRLVVFEARDLSTQAIPQFFVRSLPLVV